MTVDWRRFIPVFLIAAVVAVYANTFRVPFIFDDFNAITTNRHIRHLWPPDYLFQAPNQSTVAGRPLVSLTVALNYAISGVQPWSYHIFNLGLHVACVLLLYGIARRTTRDDWLGAAMAAIWAVHPLLTESVTYTIQRTELLMALFFLLTVYCLIRGWLLAGVAACAAGMASKEVMVVAPVIVFLYDRTFLAGSFREAWRQRSAFYLSLAGTWLVLVLIVASGPRAESAGLGRGEITPYHYALTQCDVIIHYLYLCVHPRPLVVDYDDWPIATGFADVWLAVAAMGGLVVLIVWALRFRPRLGFLGAWFLLILAPTSSVVPIVTEVAAERRLYLPLIAVVALLVVPVYQFIKLPWRRLALGGGLIVLAFLTIYRNRTYRSEESIWRDATVKRPGNVRAYINLATALAKEGSNTEACAVYETALRLDPNSGEAQYNLGITLAGLNRYADALPHFQKAVALVPRSSAAQYNFGLALARTGHPAQAEQALRVAIIIEPSSPNAHKQLGVILALTKRVGEALPEFEEAVRLGPDDEEARRYLQTALRQLGRTNEVVFDDQRGKPSP